MFPGNSSLLPGRSESVHNLIVGCGYVGQRVAETWLKRGETVTVLTRTDEHAGKLAELGCQPIIGDVTVPATLTRLPDADTLLYAVGFDRSCGKSQREIYVDGLDNVLHAVRTRVQRVVYLSSTSVYGQSAGEWVDEDSPSEPNRPNGGVCLDAEQVVRRHFETETAGQASILRLAGIYGPDRLLARVDALRSGTPFSGNPDAFLNLIHVADVVATILACETRGRAGATYLVCDDEPITRRRYFETLASLVGAPAPTFTEENAASLNKRCRNQRIHEELNVRLRFPTIDTGLAHALGHRTADES